MQDQDPVAVVPGCADSWVPPELVFDHGLGEPFTIRAAGEVLDHLGIPLVVVLGHDPVRRGVGGG